MVTESSSAVWESIRSSASSAGATLHAGFPFWLRPFLQRDVIAVTLGRRVFISPSVAEEELERLVRHELAHVRQVTDLGFLRFLWRYGSEYFANRRKGLSTRASYDGISFEVEARAAEEAV